MDNKLRLVPMYSFNKCTDISPGFLKLLGIKFIMLDLDNTIAKYSEHAPSATAKKWVEDMAISNITLYFISNSKREHRVRTFSEALDIPYINNAQKPSPDSLHAAMKTAGFRQDETAFVGDQIFTDTLASNRAKVASIIVRPLSLKNPLLLLRFIAELPFRAICAIKSNKSKLSL